VLYEIIVLTNKTNLFYYIMENLEFYFWFILSIPKEFMNLLTEITHNTNNELLIFNNLWIYNFTRITGKTN